VSGDDKDGARPGSAHHAVATICNSRGLHARAAARFVRLAETFDAEITVQRDDLTVPGTSILGLMMLAAGPGTEILISASGTAASDAVAALRALVARGFDETG
jgi:phosphocarrier protein